MRPRLTQALLSGYSLKVTGPDGDLLDMTLLEIMRLCDGHGSKVYRVMVGYPEAKAAPVPIPISVCKTARKARKARRRIIHNAKRLGKLIRYDDGRPVGRLQEAEACAMRLWRDGRSLERITTYRRRAQAGKVFTV